MLSAISPHTQHFALREEYRKQSVSKSDECMLRTALSFNPSRFLERRSNSSQDLQKNLKLETSCKATFSLEPQPLWSFKELDDEIDEEILEIMGSEVNEFAEEEGDSERSSRDPSYQSSPEFDDDSYSLSHVSRECFAPDPISMLIGETKREIFESSLVTSPTHLLSFSSHPPPHVPHLPSLESYHHYHSARSSPTQPLLSPPDHSKCPPSLLSPRSAFSLHTSPRHSI